MMNLQPQNANLLVGLFGCDTNLPTHSGPAKQKSFA